jgi:hypothetical protein
MVRIEVARAGAGEELGCDGVDHPPLRRAGVLRLVDEDVVEAAVEAPEHPGGGLAVLQKRPGALDQVLEVEQAGGGLARGVAGEEGAGKGVEGAGPLPGGAGDAVAAGALGAEHHFLDLGHERRMRRADALGGEVADLGGERLVLLGAPSIEQD